MTRRSLLTSFRHKTALLGDGVSYLGQFVILIGVSVAIAPTLPIALFIAAGTMALAACLQAWQAQLNFGQIAPLKQVVASYWELGRWSFANNLVSLLRVQIFPWALAAYSGVAAAGAFQAISNVVNLINPLTMGLCNVIPQAAAQARIGGDKSGAWRAARAYIQAGIPPAFICFAVVLCMPEIVLRVLYGADTPFIDQAFALRILVLAWAAGYVVDLVCAFLHGVDGGGAALVVNVVGWIAVAVVAVPLVASYGILGCCLALAFANLARLLAAGLILKTTIASQSPKPA
jgi:O-antigen/teichoic acid export membrane protein